MIAFKNILSSIADVGQKLFKRKIVEIKKNDYETALDVLSLFKQDITVPKSLKERAKSLQIVYKLKLEKMKSDQS